MLAVKGLGQLGDVPLEAQCDRIGHPHDDAEQETGGLGVPQGDGDKVGGAADVHRVAHDIKREAGHHLVHEDAKVVAEVGAGHAQHPHGRHDEHAAERKQRDRHCTHRRVLERGVGRLEGQCVVVQVVAQDTQRKDGHREDVASKIGPVAQQSRQRAVVVFCVSRATYRSAQRRSRTWG